MSPHELRDELRQKGRITISLKVIPKASRSEVAGLLEDGSLKVKVTAAPEKGRANAAVCELLAGFFDVPRRNVTVVSGETSRIKTVVVEAVR